MQIALSEEPIPNIIKTYAVLALAAQLAAYFSSHDRAHILRGSSIIAAGKSCTDLMDVLQKALNKSSDYTLVDALLQFCIVHVMSSSSLGNDIEMIRKIMHVLVDTVNSTSIPLGCLAAKAVQKLMDCSTADVESFNISGLVEYLAGRLHPVVHEDAVDDDQKRLIKSLLKALGSATYGRGNTLMLLKNAHNDSWPTYLSFIFANKEKFGGDVYFSAVTVMSELIQKDPSCFSKLYELGLPNAFLSSLAGMIPSAKAITCVSRGLGAICLDANGLDEVNTAQALEFFVDIFTSRKYVLAVNEGVFPLVNAIEGLLRGVPSLRDTGAIMIIRIIDKLSALGDDGHGCSGSSKKGGNSNAMALSNSSPDDISNERFAQICIFHVMVLVHKIMGNQEICSLFTKK
ncbi:E3 ubiquitin-protein ligase UPL1-like isoform X2 [Papaver somniferum]|uniref:E3 ubiquitin-protein ligase UPL1-like isoform X2 n=1 Tax=Papaver somniferum TaxID=3469 RepID=UPI000E6F903B|nr:E3 ubiquitin-protein ligase UPL1-like isoform X2 [Papaver somniferum]